MASFDVTVAVTFRVPFDVVVDSIVIASLALIPPSMFFSNSTWSYTKISLSPSPHDVGVDMTVVTAFHAYLDVAVDYIANAFALALSSTDFRSLPGARPGSAES